MITLAEATATIDAWKRRLNPMFFTLLGGEPTLNPQLADFVYLARAAWPMCRIVLTTNGFFLERHPVLPKALYETNTCIELDDPSQWAGICRRARKIKETLDRWLAQYPFKIRIEDAARRWTRRHHGVGPDVLPFEDNDLRASWRKCACRTCRQLFRGRLWKCSSIAYLQLQKERYPDLSTKWDPYLAYKGLGPDCTDAELDAFLGREEESICGMCPANPEPFAKPSPLIPLSTILKNHTAAK